MLPVPSVLSTCRPLSLSVNVNSTVRARSRPSSYSCPIKTRVAEAIAAGGTCLATLDNHENGVSVVGLPPPPASNDGGADT
mmetsp:Transcript_20504/g.45636  ORF Transcript_20504/g.45636 Transcript_20504/m.45636 type:complete len:81 (+) Transcript_20504:334-576(+)